MTDCFVMCSVARSKDNFEVKLWDACASFLQVACMYVM